MTKQETIQVLQSIEDRAVDFPNMTACDWVAIAAAKRHLENSLEVKEVDLECTKSVFEGQYLNKDKVVTTIERLQDECEEKGDNNGVDLLEKLFNKLDTLETKEVDFEKIWKEYFKQDGDISALSVKPIAKYFFELGLRAQSK